MDTEKIVVCLVLIFLMTFLAQKPIVQGFETFTDSIGTALFEPNVKSVAVECFGEEIPNPVGAANYGYWDGAANNMTQTHSLGPPVGGTQSAAYQLYQQAVNAATPTISQLEKASNLPGGGYGYVDTPEAPGLVPPAGDPFYDAAAVNYSNRRAEMISPCAQNAPTFVASSLLPKINLPGQPSWDVYDTAALANQNFLSATQQIGVSTVLGSLRNASRDLRNNIPNPINVVSPWNNSTIVPDLQRRPLDAYVPADGIYGCGMSCSYPNPSHAPLR